MTIYDIRLVRREEVAQGTMAFHFEKPDGFSFKPGQAIDLILTDPENPDTEIGRHAFSLVSAPYQNELVIATRMRDSAYKHALGSLPMGGAAKLEGPFGSLTLHGDATRPAVFIAGGIGITPFMSILRHTVKDPHTRDLSLIYANRKPEDAAFLDELKQIAKANERFKLIATITQKGESGLLWDGRTGPIDSALIAGVVEGKPAPVYYVVGPPGLIQAVNTALNNIWVSDDDIRSEGFYGY